MSIWFRPASRFTLRSRSIVFYHARLPLLFRPSDMRPFSAFLTSHASFTCCALHSHVAHMRKNQLAHVRITICLFVENLAYLLICHRVGVCLDVFICRRDKRAIISFSKNIILYAIHMNFSDAFKQTSQLCRFSPDGVYLVLYSCSHVATVTQRNENLR